MELYGITSFDRSAWKSDCNHGRKFSTGLYPARSRATTENLFSYSEKCSTALNHFMSIERTHTYTQFSFFFCNTNQSAENRDNAHFYFCVFFIYFYSSYQLIFSLTLISFCAFIVSVFNFVPFFPALCCAIVVTGLMFLQCNQNDSNSRMKRRRELRAFHPKIIQWILKINLRKKIFQLTLFSLYCIPFSTF